MMPGLIITDYYVLGGAAERGGNSNQPPSRSERANGKVQNVPGTLMIKDQFVTLGLCFICTAHHTP